MKKILIFSPPFSGHLNILKELIKEYRNRYTFHLVITGWSNIPTELKNIDPTLVTSLAGSELHETDPALWTFPRVGALYEECLRVTKELAPDLILYDFFSIEGYFVGRQLGIPYWCSIPAMIGPYTTQNYLKEKLEHPRNQEAIAKLRTKHTIQINEQEIEMISDGMHFPGEINIVWSFLGIIPHNYKFNRQDKPYIFVGNLRGDNAIKAGPLQEKPIIYFSLGTVVMNNVWNQQEDIRYRIVTLVETLAARWAKSNYHIIFVTQGKQVLDKYPRNWEIHETVDQINILAKADVFITHGGSNSFHEAVMQKVPLVVLPFFGDQYLVSQWVEKLGIGKAIIKKGNIDTKTAKNVLGSDTAEKIEQAVFEVLTKPDYQRKYYEINSYAIPFTSLVENKIPMLEGDLLYGTNKARQQYVTETNAQNEFRIMEFTAFSELALRKTSLPRIVDIYNDSLRNTSYFEKDISSKFKGYREVLHSFKVFLQGETNIEKMCLKGLDYFGELFKIHFILENYDPTVNVITTKEINHVLLNQERFQHSVFFYQKHNNHWVPRSFDEVRKQLTRKIEKSTNRSHAKHQTFYVGSENKIKIGAVQEGLATIYTTTKYHVETVSLPLNFNKQLVGMEELIYGVTLRLQELEAHVQKETKIYDVLVSIGNGIVKKEDVWYDVGIVLLKDAEGRTAIAKSSEMLLPKKYVKQAKLEGFDKQTVGAKIAEAVSIGEVSIDPHSYLTVGKVSRQFLLKNAFIRAYQTLLSH